VKRRLPGTLWVLAAIFMLAGLGLMVAALRVETRTPQQASSVPEASAALVVPTSTTTVAAATRVAASQPRATTLFVRAQSAGRDLAYSGVKKVTRWEDGVETSVLVRVDHVPGHGTTVTAQDGSGSPAAANVMVEPGADDETATFDALVANYRLAAEGSGTVLGRDAEVVDAHRADGSIAARFWLDATTGLVLKRTLLAADGSPVETIGYVRVSFSSATAVPSATAASPTAWDVVDAAGVDRLRAAGWTVPERLDGGLRLFQVREKGGAGADATIVQLGYTDGLESMSVFLQDGSLDDEAMDGYVPVSVGGREVWVRKGALFYVWQTDGSATPAADASAGAHTTVVSVLADSSRAPVGYVLAAYPPRAVQDGGVGDQITRGVQRLGDWIDPLG